MRIRKLINNRAAYDAEKYRREIAQLIVANESRNPTPAQIDFATDVLRDFALGDFTRMS